MKKLSPISKIELLLFSESINYTKEVKFDDTRKWRFDVVIIPFDYKIAIEVHGGTWTRGRHVRGQGFADDREKMNAAICQGWAVLEYTSQQIDGRIITDIEKLIALRAGK